MDAALEAVGRSSNMRAALVGLPGTKGVRGLHEAAWGDVERRDARIVVGLLLLEHHGLARRTEEWWALTDSGYRVRRALYRGEATVASAARVL